MKVSTMLPIMAIVAVLNFTSCSSESLPEDNANAINLIDAPVAKDIEMDILQLINDYRLENGFTALNNHNIIKSVAFSHTDYMIEVDNVSHDNFFERKTSLQQNANAISVSENVAYGFSSAQSVVNAWINSPGHKANLEGDYTDFDISAEQNEEGDWYFTNIFIKR
ncbi:CAP domain-containing protein [Ichthyenterobacterium sp. W332]|uniref:CAP domain-containing protein n=1 Tax=Microcosmobacter mediterraneus TaxID=3075607 RepID=A0ABU2YKW1_9FLAO|nr:CAP domain-containing protein [Ichthyenterobacterium sp. W332]MDT0557668.1 CAP domain-containing protein [Ichthyenterobacterium sp. W332]